MVSFFDVLQRTFNPSAGALKVLPTNSDGTAGYVYSEAVFTAVGAKLAYTAFSAQPSWWISMYVTGTGANGTGAAGSGTRILTAFNTTNVPMSLSFDATVNSSTGTNSIKIPAGGTLTLALAEAGLEVTSTVAGRATDGTTAPTSGDLIVNIVRAG
jgi:hypothetical protein